MIYTSKLVSCVERMSGNNIRNEVDDKIQKNEEKN